MSMNCIRLSNAPSFFSSSDMIPANNTYSGIMHSQMYQYYMVNHNLDKMVSTVVKIVCNCNMQAEVQKSFERLKDIQNLPFDWNGYGAKPFSSVLIGKCEQIVSILSEQPSIYPTGRNSIQFQYELKDRSYLEFEIFEKKTLCLEVPKRIYSQAIEMEWTDSDIDKIKESVDRFYGRNCTEK